MRHTAAPQLAEIDIAASLQQLDRPNTLSGDESIELPEFDDPPADPIALLHRWLAIAAEYDVREPGAVVLATADAQGRPSSRVVLLKEIADGALVFTTHTDSRKARDLAASGWASMTFYWRETSQQITVRGPVEILPDARSDELFDQRPPAAQATTAVSEQSRPLADERLLHIRAQALIDAGAAVPRPHGWAGYRLVPQAVEFWQGRVSRLHRRLEYTRTDTAWTNERLQP
jgi:dihydrophenazinedicarboxylate synthase